MEYTLISVAVFAAVAWFALSIAKISRKHLLVVCLVAVIFQLVFDNYMTWVGLWSFDMSKTLGLAVPVIPLENLIFGIDLAIATVASWESLKGGRAARSG